jgi:hypothetical protein
VTYRRGLPFTDAAIAVDVSAEATTSTGGSEASLKKSPVENTSTLNTDWCDIRSREEGQRK